MDHFSPFPVTPGQILTHTAESLLAQAHQHVEAEVAVRRLAEVLQAPHVDAVLLESGAVDTWAKGWKLG